MGHNFYSPRPWLYHEPRKKHVLSGDVTVGPPEIKDGVKYVVSGYNMKIIRNASS